MKDFLRKILTIVDFTDFFIMYTRLLSLCFWKLKWLNKYTLDIKTLLNVLMLFLFC